MSKEQREFPQRVCQKAFTLRSKLFALRFF
jgi:hypothetical protein